MKLAVVVQRYGVEVSGGAELHARYIAEHLSRHADVRVLTTCARDYITWKNEFPAGETLVNAIPVERFPVARERNLRVFARRSACVFDGIHSLQEELDWLDSEGPVSPALLERLKRGSAEFDFVLFFCVRYHHVVHGMPLVGPRAVLVPTAEREPSIGLSLMPSVFLSARAVMFNTDEERALIEGVCGAHVNGPVVGVGSEIPSDISGPRARHRFGLEGPYVVYVGRIDAKARAGGAAPADRARG